MLLLARGCVMHPVILRPLLHGLLWLLYVAAVLAGIVAGSAWLGIAGS